MEGADLDCQPSVLIVDRSEETREVLQTALERRGVKTFAAGRARRGLELARRHHPNLIVLDLELDTTGPDELSADFVEHSRTEDAPLVMIGSARREGPPAPRGEFVVKPYHYATLIRKIEQLLSTTRQPVTRSGG